MGAIWFNSREFGGILSETAGYRSGLALNEDRLRAFLVEGGYADLWPIDDRAMRVRAETFEEVHAHVLRCVGVDASDYEPYPLLAVWRKVKDDRDKLDVFEGLQEGFLAFLRAETVREQPNPIDPRPFIDSARSTYGQVGARIALELIDAIGKSQRNDLWSRDRRHVWQGTRDLDELFRSERLAGPHGTYFDQRFANFLAANFNEIDRINWRQFEGLAAEYFRREGYEVELGPGRGDGGVDIRLRPQDDSEEGVPTVVLVQCKRQRTRVSSTVVKALWADVVAESASGGMIVTTSALSPSAATMRTARNYPVDTAERDRLAEWLQRMTSPGAGVFLAR